MWDYLACARGIFAFVRLFIPRAQSTALSVRISPIFYPCRPRSIRHLVYLTVGELSRQFCGGTDCQSSMSSIHFTSDAIRPVRSNGAPGGVYSTRNNSNPSVLAEKARIRDNSIEEGSDEGIDLKQEGDIKKKQVTRFETC